MEINREMLLQSFREETELKQAEALTIAQDEASFVVFGMPGKLFFATPHKKFSLCPKSPPRS